MEIQVKQNCPLDKFNPCRQFECAWFMKIAGKNPNTGKDVEDWGCAVAWLPVLMIENSQQQRSTSAAVETFRNEMVRANEISHHILLSNMQNNGQDLKLIDGESK